MEGKRQDLTLRFPAAAALLTEPSAWYVTGITLNPVAAYKA